MLGHQIYATETSMTKTQLVQGPPLGSCWVFHGAPCRPPCPPVSLHSFPPSSPLDVCWLFSHILIFPLLDAGFFSILGAPAPTSVQTTLSRQLRSNNIYFRKGHGSTQDDRSDNGYSMDWTWKGVRGTPWLNWMVYGTDLAPVVTPCWDHNKLCDNQNNNLAHISKMEVLTNRGKNMVIYWVILQLMT